MAHDLWTRDLNRRNLHCSVAVGICGNGHWGGRSYVSGATVERSPNIGQVGIRSRAAALEQVRTTAVNYQMQSFSQVDYTYIEKSIEWARDFISKTDSVSEMYASIARRPLPERIEVPAFEHEFNFYSNMDKQVPTLSGNTLSVFRVQTKKNTGLYRANTGCSLYDTEGRHPPPKLDTKLRKPWIDLENLDRERDYFFGFKDLDQLRSWIYQEEWRIQIERRGLYIQEYVCPEEHVIYGDTQAVFKYRGANAGWILGQKLSITTFDPIVETI